MVISLIFVGGGSLYVDALMDTVGQSFIYNVPATKSRYCFATIHERYMRERPT